MPVLRLSGYLLASYLALLTGVKCSTGQCSSYTIIRSINGQNQGPFSTCNDAILAQVPGGQVYTAKPGANDIVEKIKSTLSSKSDTCLFLEGYSQGVDDIIDALSQVSDDSSFDAIRGIVFLDNPNTPATSLQSEYHCKTLDFKPSFNTQDDIVKFAKVALITGFTGCTSKRDINESKHRMIRRHRRTRQYIRSSPEGDYLQMKSRQTTTNDDLLSGHSPRPAAPAQLPELAVPPPAVEVPSLPSELPPPSTPIEAAGEVMLSDTVQGNPKLFSIKGITAKVVAFISKHFPKVAAILQAVGIGSGPSTATSTTTTSPNVSSSSSSATTSKDAGGDNKDIGSSKVPIDAGSSESTGAGDLGTLANLAAVGKSNPSTSSGSTAGGGGSLGGGNGASLKTDGAASIPGTVGTGSAKAIFGGGDAAGGGGAAAAAAPLAAPDGGAAGGTGTKQ